MEVLERLLTVGLADEAVSVRQEVVSGLEVSELWGLVNPAHASER